MKQFNDRLAVWVTRLTSSMWFFYAFLLLVALWMIWSPAFHLDTRPQYPVMLYWVNLYQALMMIILGIGQIVLNRQNEARAAQQFAIVQKLDRVLARLEGQVADIEQRAEPHASPDSRPKAPDTIQP